MSVKYSKCSNNAGFSLIELIVAIAISSFVIIATMVLLTNGINSYRRQTITAQVQEDADLALTHISDAVFEADKLSISMSESRSKSTTEFIIKEDNTTGEKYGYKYDKDKLELRVISGGVESILCTNVTYFKVQVLRESIVESTNDKGEIIVGGLRDRVQVKVTLEVEENDISRQAARVTGVRNRMDVSDLTFADMDATDYNTVEDIENAEFLVKE